jgi:DNA-binding CsgD family transcriptional regulator
MSSGTHEVWARVALAAVALHKDAGVSVDTLLAGLPFDEHGLKRRKRVAWDDYVAIIDRLCEAVGGFNELEDLCAGSYHQVLPELRALAGSVIGPKMFVRFVTDVLNPIMFPPVANIFEDLGEHRVRVTTRLRPGARECEAFFRGSTGAFRGITAHLDLPMVDVVVSDVGPTHGIWELELPPAKTLLSRAYRSAHRLMLRFQLGAESDGTPVSMVIGAPDLDPMAARIDRAVVEWKLTPRQADVLSLIVEGRTNKEIAQALACADNTVELHVTRLLRKTGTSSRTQLIAVFWSEEWGFPQ